MNHDHLLARISHLHGRDINKIADLTPIEIEAAYRHLFGHADERAALIRALTSIQMSVDDDDETTPREMYLRDIAARALSGSSTTPRTQSEKRA